MMLLKEDLKILKRSKNRDDFRIAIGGFGAESNAFSIEKAGDESASIVSDESLIHQNRGRKTAIGGFIDVLEVEGASIIPTSKIFWGTTGIVRRESYEKLGSFLLEKIREADADGILLDMHGAMLSEDEPDGEGVLLKRIRDLVGEEIPILCVLDIHGNITDLKVQIADAIFGYKTNPHIDLYVRGKKAAETLMRILRREVKPVMRIRRLPMLGHNLGMSTWSPDPETEKRLPFSRIMKRVEQLEDGKIIDVSVFIGFPYSDTSDSVVTTLAITNCDVNLAQETANRVAAMVWEAREEFLNIRPLVSVEEAVEEGVRSERGPVILVDVGDNSGGGAPCDSTVILQALLCKGVEEAVVPLRDPEAVEKAFKLGPGATIELDVGGKIDGRFSSPVHIKARIKTITDGEYTIRGPHHGGFPTKERVLPREAWSKGYAGRTVLLKAESVEIIISEGRVGMERDYYKSVGVDPEERKIVVVKSAQAHRASFEGIAQKIIEVDTPGPTSASYKGLNFRNIKRPIWPLDPL
ncbi:MAG: M81 family metallopeptidase [Candidatus Bathyarchaeia archaeon]